MKQQAGALLSSIRIERAATRKVSVQLYLGLRDIILSGGVGPGDRLPASRILAREMGVSRTTVVDALERLVAEGLLVSRVGAGTFVSDILEHQRPAQPAAPEATPPAPPPRLSHTIEHAMAAFAPRARLPHRPGAFVTALPALDAFPIAQWARVSARHLRGTREDVMGYGPPQGHDGLRRAIASHLNAARGIRCDACQIFVTAGAQQAFELIGRVLLNPGDRVWYENPGATGARNALLAAGAELIPVPVDEDGMDVAEARRRAPHFRLAFVTPSHQQPLGHVMSLARRLELLEAAGSARALVIEDDYDGEFTYSGRPVPPLKGVDTADRVLYVGTFSKTLFPALRLGYVLVPQGLVAAFDRLFASWVGTPATHVQAAVAEFMEEGLFATHIRMMRRLYAARHDALIYAARDLPDTIRVARTGSGFHTTASLDARVDETRLIDDAAAAGVTIVPISRYALSPPGHKGLVLGFGSTAHDDIRAGVRVLRDLPSLGV